MLSPIKTNLSQKLKDKGYRHRFFKGLAEDEIAFGLRRYRIERGLNQSKLANLSGMKQSAISRIEQASYAKWNFNTLWRIADALDVRVAVKIDSMEEAVRAHTEMETASLQAYAPQQTGMQYTLTAKMLPGTAAGIVVINGMGSAPLDLNVTVTTVGTAHK